MVARLQAKASQIGNILTSLEKKYEKGMMNQAIREENDGEAGEMKKSHSSSSHLGRSDSNSAQRKRLSMRIDPIPPFNPNKQKKSKTPGEDDLSDEDVSEQRQPDPVPSTQPPEDKTEDTPIDKE